MVETAGELPPLQPVSAELPANPNPSSRTGNTKIQRFLNLGHNLCENDKRPLHDYI